MIFDAIVKINFYFTKRLFGKILISNFPAILRLILLVLLYFCLT